MGVDSTAQGGGGRWGQTDRENTTEVPEGRGRGKEQRGENGGGDGEERNGGGGKRRKEKGEKEERNASKGVVRGLNPVDWGQGGERRPGGAGQRGGRGGWEPRRGDLPCPEVGGRLAGKKRRPLTWRVPPALGVPNYRSL